MPWLVRSNPPLGLVWRSGKSHPLPLTLNKDVRYNENTYRAFQQLKIAVYLCLCAVLSEGTDISQHSTASFIRGF